MLIKIDNCILSCRDNIESAKQKYFGFGDDLYLMSHNWGFEITDVPKVYACSSWSPRMYQKVGKQLFLYFFFPT
jgi:hypothetical protein